MKFREWMFKSNSERRRLKAIEKGHTDYYPYSDGLLCLSVEEKVEDFFKGLSQIKLNGE